MNAMNRRIGLGMFRQLRQFLLRAMCLIISLVLPLAVMPGFAGAAPATAWVGTGSLKLTAYAPNPEKGGKLGKISETVPLVVTLYLDSNYAPVVVTLPDGDFCMRLRVGSSGSTLVGIEELSGARSAVAGAGSDSLMLVGKGKSRPGEIDEGAAFLLVTKGTQTPGGNPTSMSLSGQVGGGYDGSLMWTGKFSVTLAPD